MKNIHILPTDKPSRLYQLKNDILRLDYKIDKGEANKHIYITSDEEIKEGDWFLQTTYEGIFKCSDSKIEYIYFDGDSYEPVAYCKKIILTTDQDLIKDGVQSIGEEFLEWFVQNPSCEVVSIDKNWNYPLDKSWEYKIIIQKEEPKQETLEEVAERIYPTDCTNWSIKVPLNERKAFVEVAKWQQEQIGKSEFLQKLRATLSDAEARRLIFETFNNK